MNRKHRGIIRTLALGLALLLTLGVAALAAAQVVTTNYLLPIEDTPKEEGSSDAPSTDASQDASPQATGDARQAFIDRMIALAQTTYSATGGKAQRAASGGDIYVCKNFTVYLFRQNRDDFRMAEFPDVPLVIPDNQEPEDCKPYVYGIEFKDVAPEAGNPFYAAASFRYDSDLSKAENQQKAREFLQQAQRGDFFQMAADYYYGTGAHSMVIIADYDEATNTIRWTDSNMKGEKRDGVRYGYVQYDAVKDIDWFVDAFCHKKYGATLYRLRDDIIYK